MARFLHRRGDPLERELHALRPEPPESLVRSVSDRVGRPSTGRGGLRVAAAGALTVAMLGVFAGLGGVSYAAEAAKATAKTVGAASRSSSGNEKEKKKSDDDGHKTTICHATHSSSNPYVSITVDNSSLEAHQDHQDGEDIIPEPGDGCPSEPGDGSGGGQYGGQTPICHHTSSSSNPWVLISVPSSAIPAHQAHGDIIPAPAGGCPEEDNRQPSASVALSPALSPGGTATATATVADGDDDPVLLTFVWRVDGTVVKTTANTSARSDTLSLAGVARGKVVSVTAIPNDGKNEGVGALDSGTVGNTAPSATVALSSPLRPGGTATATATRSDPDGDAVTLTYVWKVGGTVAKTTSAAASLTDTLSLAGVASGTSVQVTVTPADEIDTGVPATATGTVAANTPPTATVSLDDELVAGGSAVAKAKPADADGDVVTLTFVWKVDGDVKRTTTGTSATDTFPLADVKKKQTVSVEVTPSDGFASGATVSAAQKVKNS